MKCPPIVNLEQRASELGETEEGPHREENHSVRNLQATGEQEVGIRQREKLTSDKEGTKERIKWPPRKESKLWSTLDDQLQSILDATLIGHVDRKIRIMTSVVYNHSKEMFGKHQKVTHVMK